MKILPLFVVLGWITIIAFSSFLSIPSEEEQVKALDDFDGYWPMPRVEDLYIIYDLSYLEQLLSKPSSILSSQRIIVALVSVNLQYDSYLTLYIGYLTYLFDTMFPSQVTFLIYQPSSPSNQFDQVDRIQSTIYFLSLLPKKSIFIAMEHGPSSFGINSLELLRNHEIGPTIIYHVNHEQPWITNIQENQLDFTYSKIEDLQAAYLKHDLIIRNYYYQPLVNVSYYLPINAPYYSFIINNISSTSIRSLFQIPASQRKYKCLFRGRTNYTSRYYDVKHSSLSDSEQHRKSIYELHTNGQLNQCYFNEFNVNKPGQYFAMIKPYQEYMRLIAQSAFVLCPSGNNPETFRLREALEVGAIPLMIRPTVEEKNFLNHELWQNYPGPVFTSWNEVNPFLEAITLREMDELQKAVQQWFYQFQKQILSSLSNRITEAFEKIDRNQRKQKRLHSLRQVQKIEEIKQNEEVNKDGQSRNIFVKYRILDTIPIETSSSSLNEAQGDDNRGVLGHRFYVNYQKNFGSEMFISEEITADSLKIQDNSEERVRSSVLSSTSSSNIQEILKTMMITIVRQQEKIEKLQQENFELKQQFHQIMTVLEKI